MLQKVLIVYSVLSVLSVTSIICENLNYVDSNPPKKKDVNQNVLSSVYDSMKYNLEINKMNLLNDRNKRNANELYMNPNKNDLNSNAFQQRKIANYLNNNPQYSSSNNQRLLLNNIPSNHRSDYTTGYSGYEEE